MSFIYNQDESCKSKNAYETFEDADEVRGKQASKSGKPLKIYKCEVCGFYHLTSRKDG